MHSPTGVVLEMFNRAVALQARADALRRLARKLRLAAARPLGAPDVGTALR